MSDQMRKTMSPLSPACKHELRAESSSSPPPQIRQLAETIAAIGFIGVIIADEHGVVIGCETDQTCPEENDPT